MMFMKGESQTVSILWRVGERGVRVDGVIVGIWDGPVRGRETMHKVCFYEKGDLKCRAGIMGRDIQNTNMENGAYTHH